MGVGDLVAAVWSMVICDMVMVRCGGKYIKQRLGDTNGVFGEF